MPIRSVHDVPNGTHPRAPPTFAHPASPREDQVEDSLEDRPTGTSSFTKIKKRKTKKNLNSHNSQLNRNSSCRTPPPRGAPGAPLGASEECSPPREGTTTQAGGVAGRRARRRAYRKWRRQGKNERETGMGSLLLVPTQPQQATPTRAQWFKHTLFWQEQHKRKKARRVTNYPTTPPLGYDKKVKIGSLNVQGCADTLKLKNSLQLMQEHNLDILFLSETRATSYYSYLSENHLVVLSDNTREKYAGVGAIIAPHFRPHLLNIIQLSSRIIHITFKKQGGNLHFVGVYAPHSGLYHETIRQPFWDQLESHINSIPAPEPVYITGDFNVRFQASHKNDEGVTGKFTYGKGSRCIDHNATAVRTMSRLGI